MFAHKSDDPAMLEKAFREAYTRRHGMHIKEFRQIGDNSYQINGVRVSEVEVYAMLETMQHELAEKNKGLIYRLIEFFSRS